MAGTLTRGYTFGATEEVTAAKLHALVDDGSVAGITADDIASGTITNDKIQSVSGAKFVTLSTIPAGAGVIPSANLPSQASTIIGTIYPVGSLYISTLSTNPATLLGVGTWSAFGEGRVLLSAGGGYTAGDTGGAATANLAHTHDFTPAWDSTSTPRSPEQLVVGRTGVNQISNAYNPSGNKTTLSGGSTTQSILQPYIVVYMWRRTA